MGRVLIEVDEHPSASFLLPPVRCHEIGAPTFELACERHSRHADLGRIPPRLQAGVDVQPTVAAGLRVAEDPELVEERLDAQGRFADLVEHDAGLGVEIDPQLV